MNETSATRKAALWVGVVFVLGAALGGMIGYSFARHSASAGLVQLPEAARRARRVEQLTKELGLTAAQARQIDAIIVQGHADSKAIRDRSDAEVATVREKARGEIRATLTPEQQPKFEDFLRRLDEERKHNAPK